MFVKVLADNAFHNAVVLVSQWLIILSDILFYSDLSYPPPAPSERTDVVFIVWYEFFWGFAASLHSHLF